MNSTASHRARWSIVALGVLVTAGASGCGTASDGRTAAGATPTAHHAGAADSASVTLRKAVTATAALHSYRFSSVQSIGAATKASTALAGEVVRPASVSYTLTAKGKRTQIVRLPAATYVRPLPGTWSKLQRPTSSADPAGSLVALLRAISRPAVTSSAAGRTVLRGRIASAALHSAGLPTSSRDVQVTVDVNAQHRVAELRISYEVPRAGRPGLAVVSDTRYSAFDAVPAVVAPI